jgi:hypothetical protein
MYTTDHIVSAIRDRDLPTRETTGCSPGRSEDPSMRPSVLSEHLRAILDNLHQANRLIHAAAAGKYSAFWLHEIIAAVTLCS